MTENITYKDSYVMYKNWSKGILKMTDEQAGQLLKSICLLQNGEETEPEEVAASVLFEVIKQKMEEDADAYKAKVDRLTKNFEQKDDSQKDDSKTQKGNKKSQMGKKKTQKGNTESQKDDVATDTFTLTDTLTDTDTLTNKSLNKEFKESYGENGNVKLTVKEREKLITEYGTDLTERAIEYLDGYIADKGYKSKSNYQAIRRWVIDAVRERKPTAEKFDADDYLLKIIRGEEDGA